MFGPYRRRYYILGSTSPYPSSSSRSTAGGRYFLNHEYIKPASWDCENGNKRERIKKLVNKSLKHLQQLSFKKSSSDAKIETTPLLRNHNGNNPSRA